LKATKQAVSKIETVKLTKIETVTLQRPAARHSTPFFAQFSKPRIYREFICVAFKDDLGKNEINED